MLGRSMSCLLAVAIFSCTALPPACGAKTSAKYTTIQVKNMHCSACAKKIASKLYRVSGVAEVRADVKKNLAYVVPQKKKSPSPKAMWEAVEAAGFAPVKLAGPTGEYKSKPKK